MSKSSFCSVSVMPASLAETGLHSGMSMDEFVSALKHYPTSLLKLWRQSLFDEAASRGLLQDSSDVLVYRMNSACRPLDLKLAEDLWSIIVCIENGEKLPRSILKNGKRSKADLNKSRMLASQSATNNCEPTLNSQSTLSCSSQNQID